MAFGQTVPTADLEQVWLDPAARGSLWVGNGQTLGALECRTAASLTYTFSQFRSVNDRAAGALTDRLGIQVMGALGVTDWLEFGANIPVFIAQASAAPIKVASAGMGNPMMYGKISILDSNRPVQLSFGLGVGVPVGTAAAQGNGGTEVLPRINLGKVYSNVQVGVELSALIRPVVDYSPVTFGSGDKVGSQIAVGGMIGSIGPGLRTELSARAFVSLAGGRAGIEAQVAARYPIGGLELFASMGPGFFGEPNTPYLRVYAGIAFANAPMTKAPCLEGEPYELADCPDLDLDQDGVSNFLDGCSAVKGPSENRGCPDTDKDGDTVVDRLDGCIDQAGPVQNTGCPWPDRDGDTVADSEDNCPKDVGPRENQGCPAAKKQLVIITREKLIIKDKVFFDTGRATILAKSNGLLDQVAAVLAQHPEIAALQVEGHTDNVGNAERNKVLSQDRANAVKAYLVKAGIEEKRLVPVGFGQERPADTNDSPAGRDNNRRVEFNILAH